MIEPNVITTKDIKVFQDRIFEKCQKLFIAKGNDYSGMSKDTFANLRLASHIGMVECDAHSAIIRGLDKIMRLYNLTDPRLEQKVKDESLEDTLADLINYFTYVVMFDQERRRKL